jgi:toluene monooxygenase system ferredoxin subunit
MAFQHVCSTDDLWEGEMAVFQVGGRDVLLLHLAGGELRAIPSSCPHQEQPLVDGTFEGNVLTCKAHQWRFDLVSGMGINPDNTRLALFPVRLDGDEVYVDLDRN